MIVDVATELNGLTQIHYHSTTARMESTGAKNRIQISQETANILEESGKGFWFTKREDKVDAKGKGELQTYWLTIKASGNRSENSGPSGTNSGSGGQESMRRLPRVESFARETYTGSQAKIDRLIDWNVEVLWNLLKQIELRRQYVYIGKAYTSENNFNRIGNVLNKFVSISGLRVLLLIPSKKSLAWNNTLRSVKIQATRSLKSLTFQTSKNGLVLKQGTFQWTK